LLVGAILHLLYAEADKTLAGVANFFSDPSRPIEATLNAMLATPHLGERAHPVVASSARELLNKSENDRSGVLSTTMSFLGFTLVSSNAALQHPKSAHMLDCLARQPFTKKFPKNVPQPPCPGRTFLPMQKAPS
jgi:hypothetical protein